MAKAKEVVKPFRRTVDPKGLDKGQAKEIESLVKHNDTFKGFEPTPPRFGNPVKQIGGALQSIFGRKNSTGNAMSPTTRTDQGHDSKTTTLTDAERERLSKRYLGR